MGERERILRLAELFRTAELGDVEQGIGDDAAVLRAPGGLGGSPSVPAARLVWTIDAQVEDQHFRRAWLSWRDLGYRSFVAAASDVSAMGGSPWCALSALSLTASMTDDDTEELARGQKEAADATGARVVGGNLSKGEIVTVTTTLLGKAERPVSRSGAQPGDGLYVVGELGLAAVGLRALERGVSDAAVETAVHAWKRPTPRVAEGLALSASAHAAIDVSDGLALDVARIAEASGVGVVLDRRWLSSLAGESLERAARAVGADAFELILGGGEDYALVAVSDVPIVGFSRIGEIREGEGVFVRGEHGDERLHDLPGFDHFRST